MIFTFLGWAVAAIATGLCLFFRMLWLEEQESRRQAEASAHWWNHGDHPDEFESLG